MTDCTSHPEALAHEATLSWSFVPALSRQIPQAQVAHSNVKAQPHSGLSDSPWARHTMIFSSGVCVRQCSYKAISNTHQGPCPLLDVPQNPVGTYTKIFCGCLQETNRGPGKRSWHKHCFSRKAIMAAAVALCLSRTASHPKGSLLP